MHLLRKQLLMALSSGVLFFVIIIGGCKKHNATVNEIPIKGAVYSVHRSNGSYKTYIDVVVGRQFSGKLPDDIDSIIVSGPHGDLSIGKDDFNYNPQWRAFWIVRPDFPEIGTYTFKVTSGNRSSYATDIQSIVTAIPIPDTFQFKPAKGEIITCTPPIFSWQKLNKDGPLFYQLEIRDIYRKHVYRTSYVRDMESVRLPPDVLNSSMTYQWRVRVADGADWISLNNRSQSGWVTFSTNQTLNRCNYSYQAPPETDDGWETSSLGRQRVDQQKIHELMHQILNENLKNIHSILVVRNGKLILEEYFYGYHRNVKHTLRSCTKSVTSILLGVACDQGKKIVLDNPLFNFLPEYIGLDPSRKKNEITLKHALTMTAGLDWNERFEPTSLQYMIKSKDCVRYVLERKLVNPPGENFMYSSGLSTVLGKILKNTTGTDADKFADEHLFTPLGITDHSWDKLPDGSVSTGWGLNLRPRDMAKIGYLFLKRGNWKGKQIVSQKWVEDSIYPHVRGELIVGTGYGYQWWRGESIISDRKIEAFYAAGHGGQYIFIIPSLDLLTVFTSQADNNNAGDFRTFSILENYIVPAILQTAPPKIKPQFDIDKYRHLEGIYRISEFKMDLKIYTDKGKLYGKTILFDHKFELLPLTKNRFVCPSKDIGNFWLDFTENSKGQAEGLNITIGFSRIPFKRTRILIFGL